MSYRSICLRAVEINGHGRHPVVGRLLRRSFTIRTLTSTPRLQAGNSEIRNGSLRKPNLSRDLGEDVRGRVATPNKSSIRDEAGVLPAEPGPATSASSDSLPAIHACYQTRIKPKPLFLPETPTSWITRENGVEASHPLRRRILRSAFLEAASHRVERRSRAIARAVKSEQRLEAMEKLLYPHRRRPLHWDRNFFTLFLARNRRKRWNPGYRSSILAEKWFQELYKDRDISEATKRWHVLPVVEKRRRWSYIMLWCLMSSPEQALNFLRFTYIEPYPPFEIVMDALLYLKMAKGDEIKANAELRSMYLELLHSQAEPTRWSYLIEKRHIGLLLEECSDEEGRDLFEKIIHAELDLSYNCLLIFMDFFTKAGDVDRALQALHLVDADVRLESRSCLLSRCTNLLRLDSIMHDGDTPNFRILPQILEAGVKPDLTLHNAIIKNAVKLGASAVGWDLFHYLRDHGLPTDARTYLMLVPDALARRDAGALQEILTAIHAREDLYQNPHLVTQVLNVVRVIHGHELGLSSSLVVSNMLAVYTRAFSTAPLRHLKIIGDEAEWPPGPNVVVPDANTLSYVLRTYVLAQHSPTVVLSLLGWIEHLRSKDDDLTLAVTKCPPLYDGFLLFFSRTRETLLQCLEIVQLMLDRGIRPSATTWGILALAFTKHGKLETGAKIKKMIDLESSRPKGKATRSIMDSVSDADPVESASVALALLEDIAPATASTNELAASAEGQGGPAEQEESTGKADHAHSSSECLPSSNASCDYQSGINLRSDVRGQVRLTSAG